MIEASMEFIARAFELDLGGWVVLMAFGGIGYTLFFQMIGDHGSALLGTPLLVLGAALANTALSDVGVQMAADKGINTAANMAAGMLVASFLVVGILWAWNATMGR